MIQIDQHLKAEDLSGRIRRLWEVSAAKIRAIEQSWDVSRGSPVFTVQGKYQTRGWTDWTQGFQYGSALLQFDATGDEEFLEIGRRSTLEQMTPHVTHMGVHDHGFNIISTYGNLSRLIHEGRMADSDGLGRLSELALKVSGAVQARRWTKTSEGGGFIYSFNGPHSLFADTIRSLRSLAAAHCLGHSLVEDRDVEVSLLERLVEHARTTAKYNVFYGEGMDIYDVRGRVAHESIFNPSDGHFRSPSTQQGYSPFSTWTRGLAWIMCGYAEELEFLHTCRTDELDMVGQRSDVEAMMLKAAQAACDFYIENSPADGIPYWDTGAPGLSRMGDYLERNAEPFNEWEPVDSSAAAIAAQGLLRLGRYLEEKRGLVEDGKRYWQAGLTVVKALLGEPYLSLSEDHQGLMLHSIYHRPRGWDHVPDGSKIPHSESSMWGDYHIREVALYLQRVARGESYYTFFAPGAGSEDK